MWSALLISALVLLIYFPVAAQAGLSSGSPDWLREARVAGLSVQHQPRNKASLASDTASLDLIDGQLDELLAEGVNVVEGDSRLSDYITDEEFEKEIRLIREVTARAHARGMKAVWYYPSLEVITADGMKMKKTMYRDHPDWVSLSFDRRTRCVFYGAKVFWVEKKDESAWMCPNSPYREYFFGRVKRLAETGLDALWLDVPLFNLVIGKWACACPYCREKFEKETGMIFPRVISFKDRAFLRYVQWRHDMIAEFLEEAQGVIKSVNPEMVCLVETVSLDHLGGSDWGLDGTMLKSNHIVWEVDSVSDTTAMRDANRTDWLTQMIVYKYCAGVRRPDPSWAFCYGYNEPDAQLVMAGAIAAQLNPYETRVPKMTLSVGRDFRTMMYQWIATHSADIFRSESAADACILYSGRNRDQLDGWLDGGYFTNVKAPEAGMQWWASSPKESAFATHYISEYRGWAKLLIDRHVPFDIRALNRVKKEDLSRYRTVILPNAVSLSPDEIAVLKSAAEEGAVLVVTGPECGELDVSGARAAENPWGPGAKGGGPVTVSMGRGKIVVWRSTPGSIYYKGGEGAQMFFGTALESLADEGVPVYLQTYRRDNRIIVHLLNYGWAGPKAVAPSLLNAPVRLPLRPGESVVSVEHSQPGESQPQQLASQVKDGYVHFTVPVKINSLVTIVTK
jgi:hypothetical protein